MLQVDDLDRATSFAPAMRESVTSHQRFRACGGDARVRRHRPAAVLHGRPPRRSDPRGAPTLVAIQLTYWLVTRAEDSAQARGSPPSWTRSATACTKQLRRTTRGCVSDAASVFAPCVSDDGAMNAMTMSAPAHVAAVGRVPAVPRTWRLQISRMTADLDVDGRSSPTPLPVPSCRAAPCHPGPRPPQAAAISN